MNKNNIITTLENLVTSVAEKNEALTAVNIGKLNKEVQGLPDVVATRITTIANEIKTTTDFEKAGSYIVEVGDLLDNTKKRLDEQQDLATRPKESPDYQEKNYFKTKTNPYDPGPSKK